MKKIKKYRHRTRYGLRERATRLEILGMPVDNLGRQDYLNILESFLRGHRLRHVVTVNPEYAILAENNQRFSRILSAAHLAIPDGFGLTCAGVLRGVWFKRLPGSDLTSFLLGLAEKKGLRVAIVCRPDGLSDRLLIEKTLRKKYPGLIFRVEEYYPKKGGENHSDIESLKKFKPMILFSALGAPEQEYYIEDHAAMINSLRLAIGVGGSFDFLTGAVKRAPAWLRFLGLEWLWRGFSQPKQEQDGKKRRWRRIWRAAVLFPSRVIVWELRRWRFRPNVVAMIINDNQDVLIINGAGSRNYWGLPQGGVDPGENRRQAVLREVNEETGLVDLEIISSYKNIYSYKLPHSNHWHGYKGQKQTLFIMRYHKDPQAVCLNPYEHKAYRWVPVDRLVAASSPVRRKQYELFLSKYQQVKDRL